MPLEQHHKIGKKKKHTETDRQPKLKTLFLHLCQIKIEKIESSYETNHLNAWDYLIANYVKGRFRGG